MLYLALGTGPGILIIRYLCNQGSIYLVDRRIRMREEKDGTSDSADSGVHRNTDQRS